MNKKMSNVWTLNFLAYLFLVLGIVGSAHEFLTRFLFSFPLDLGIYLGYAGIIVAGLLATLAVSSLKELDRRLQRIEDIQHRQQQ